MKIKADLHNHLSTLSNIPKEFNKTLDIAKKRLGKNGILGIINGGDDNRYEDFINLRGYERQNLGNAIYVPGKEILVLRGQEVFTKQGHLLVLGLKRDIHLKSNQNLENSLKAAKDNNGIIIAVHPFFIFGAGNYLAKNPILLEYFDGIEIFNGEAFYGNKKAREFYNQIKGDYGIGVVSSSDGHSLYEIGFNYTWLEKPNIEDSEKLNYSLRNSIKEHKDYFEDNQNLSIVGSLEHSIKLAPIEVLHRLKKLTQHTKNPFLNKKN